MRPACRVILVHAAVLAARHAAVLLALLVAIQLADPGPAWLEVRP